MAYFHGKFICAQQIILIQTFMLECDKTILKEDAKRYHPFQRIRKSKSIFSNIHAFIQKKDHVNRKRRLA